MASCACLHVCSPGYHFPLCISLFIHITRVWKKERKKERSSREETCCQEETAGKRDIRRDCQEDSTLLVSMLPQGELENQRLTSGGLAGKILVDTYLKKIRKRWM